MTAEQIYESTVKELPNAQRQKLAHLILNELPASGPTDLSVLIGGLPDERSAEEILDDLWQCRKLIERS